MIPTTHQLTAPAVPLQLTAGAQPIALLPAKCKTTTDAERWAAIRAKAAAITVAQTCKSRWEKSAVDVLGAARVSYQARHTIQEKNYGVL